MMRMKRPMEPTRLAEGAADWTADYVARKSADSAYRFRHLAFAWENLFPACVSCQMEKREMFDERLLKPDEATYDFDRYFVLNVKDGALAPNPAGETGDQARAQLTIDILGLNAAPRRTSRLWWFERHYKDVVAFSDSELSDLPYRYLASFTEVW